MSTKHMNFCAAEAVGLLTAPIRIISYWCCKLRAYYFVDTLKVSYQQRFTSCQINFFVVLQPYKYAGYSQLIKTIQIETADEQLFSKNAPLLTAACELAYHTVQCSALNAEELRRENGLEVNKNYINEAV